jgi:hypothetical protein
MECWKCGKELKISFNDKISFRATCDFCHIPLHCCKNCKNYMPGKPNNCLIPGTDYVSNREGINFCEEFQIYGKLREKKLDDAKKRFDSLFKDDS